MGWKTYILEQTPQDWQFYTNMESVDIVTGRLNLALVNHIDDAFYKAAQGQDIQDCAKDVVGKMEILMKKLSDFGASDSEPYEHLLFLISTSFGFDVRRL